MSPVTIVSLHDVAPGTVGESLEMMSMVESRGIRATLLVVPGPFRGSSMQEAPDFGRWLGQAAARGHEIALHGWSHEAVHDPHGPNGTVRRRAGRLLTRGCAEFHSLGILEASRRIDWGLRALSDAGLSTVGFTPPGWLASPSTLVALKLAGLRYSTTQWSIIDLQTGRRVRIGAISQRSASLVSGPVATVARTVGNGMVERGRSLRIALHPRDLDDGRLVRSLEALLDRAAGCRSRTYAELDLGPARNTR